jgi:hypothetical protein
VAAWFRRFAVLLLATSSASADDTYLIPPDVPVADVSQEDWSRTWWQWAASFERAASPVADSTGRLCASNQSGDVWFLAGTYGSARTFRTCTIPRGKYLFFPIVNYIVTPNPSSTQPLSCAQAIDSAARMTDDLLRILLEIDGRPYDGLVEHRQATRQCFDLGALSRPPLHLYPVAANGYYVMLRPLPPGEHVINFGGALPSNVQLVTYMLSVE